MRTKNKRERGDEKEKKNANVITEIFTGIPQVPRQVNIRRASTQYLGGDDVQEKENQKIVPLLGISGLRRLLEGSPTSKSA